MLYRHSYCFALVWVLALLIFAGCRGSKKYEYTVPEKTGDGWETASLSSENLATEPVKELIERVYDNTYKNIHSVLIVKNEKLVVEEYFPGPDSNGKYRVYQRNTLHETCSIT